MRDRLAHRPSERFEMIQIVTQQPMATTYRLTVAAVVDIGPRMRRVSLIGDELGGLVSRPGQDVVLHLSDGGGGLSRRYTIRNLDTGSGRLDLDFVMHGHGPGAKWAASVQVGSAVEVFGPRGKVQIAAARWQLFAGDESAIAGIAEMIATLPAAATAIALLEVADADDEQPIESAAELEVAWLHRMAVPAGASDLLDRALEDTPIPSTDRHAYVFGESRVVRRLRDQLGRRGLGPTEISAKGYWNLGATEISAGQ